VKSWGANDAFPILCRPMKYCVIRLIDCRKNTKLLLIAPHPERKTTRRRPCDFVMAVTNKPLELLVWNVVHGWVINIPTHDLSLCVDYKRGEGCKLRSYVQQIWRNAGRPMEVEICAVGKLYPELDERVRVAAAPWFRVWSKQWPYWLRSVVLFLSSSSKVPL
jgi:hypothetical protein